MPQRCAFPSTFSYSGRGPSLTTICNLWFEFFSYNIPVSWLTTICKLADIFNLYFSSSDIVACQCLCLSITSYQIILYLHIYMMSSHIVHVMYITLQLCIELYNIFSCCTYLYILKTPTVVLLLKEVQHVGEDSPGSTTENVVQLQLEGVLVPRLKQVYFQIFSLFLFFAKFCHIVRFRIVILSGIWVSNFQIDFIGST